MLKMSDLFKNDWYAARHWPNVKYQISEPRSQSWHLLKINR